MGSFAAGMVKRDNMTSNKEELYLWKPEFLLELVIVLYGRLSNKTTLCRQGTALSHGSNNRQTWFSTVSMCAKHM